MSDNTNANSGQNAPAATASPDVGAQESVQAAETRVQDAEKAALKAKKSPEQDKVDAARQEADDARAKAAADEAAATARPAAMSVEEARMLVPAPADMGAGDHMAQQFGNYPANPAPYKAEHADPEKCTVQLTMVVPDHPLGARTTIVHPEMVGDYLRAGWSLAV